MPSLGQKVDIWTDEWKDVSIESEIRMWDYFGLRPWILKYTPRFGEVLEAGCGLGRYNFYLSHFGINISGLDFSEETINHLNNWQKKNGYNLKFITGNVKKLPYENNTLSGYLSFGVIEHFQEGPHEVLNEAFRVLRPGGIAIITTPNKSWNVKRRKLIRKIKDIILIIIGRKIIKPDFFQYEYTPRQLDNFMKKAKLTPTVVEGGDHLYSFTEYGSYTGNNIYESSLAYKLSPLLDKSWFKKYGSQSVTVNIKLAESMHCFLCGEKKANKKSLEKYDVPICDKCSLTELSKLYIKNNKTRFIKNYIINKSITSPKKQTCNYCQESYVTNDLFEDFGFDINACPNCLRKKEINIDLSLNHLQPIWRKKKE